MAVEWLMEPADTHVRLVDRRRVLMDAALRRVAEPVPLEDVRIVVDSILTLRETGGNLSETFDVVADTTSSARRCRAKQVDDRPAHDAGLHQCVSCRRVC